jgi:hypothetical protein
LPGTVLPVISPQQGGIELTTAIPLESFDDFEQPEEWRERTSSAIA